MDDICGVQVFHAFADLVHDVSIMQILEDLLADGIVEICFHELKHQVEVLVVVGTDHVVQLDYVRVRQLVQVADLPVRALGVD